MRIKSAFIFSAFSIAVIGAFAFEPSAAKNPNNSYEKASCTVASAFCDELGTTPCLVGTTALFSDVNTCKIPALRTP